MAICIRCENTYPDRRKALGYNTCIICGDKEAKQEADRKSKCTAPLFNKGAYQYIGSLFDAKHIGR